LAAFDWRVEGALQRASQGAQLSANGLFCCATALPQGVLNV
jgi:hypothetical protein